MIGETVSARRCNATDVKIFERVVMVQGSNQCPERGQMDFGNQITAANACAVLGVPVNIPTQGGEDSNRVDRVVPFKTGCANRSQSKIGASAREKGSP